MLHAHECRRQKRVLDLLELELQVTVNHAVCTLGTELYPFARAVRALS